MSYRSFVYDQPTKIVFGTDAVEKLGSLLKDYKAEKILFAYAGGSVRRSGLYDRVVSQIRDAGLSHVEHSGCKPNPRNTWVDEGAEKYRAEGCNFILGVGGGSVIDASKAIAIAATNPHPDGVWHYASHRGQTSEQAAPVGAILTLSATGSEGNAFAVISNEQTQEKFGFGHPSARPVFSICDPAITYSVDRWQTACGTADIISHLLEQYLHKDENTDVSDNLIIGNMKAVMKWGPVAIEQPDNYDARANLMWGSTIGLNGILGAGHHGDWTTHQLEHALSAVYDVSHGAGLACLTPYYLDYLSAQDNLGRIDRLGFDLFGLEAGRGMKRRTASAFQSFFTSMGLPATLNDFPNVNVTEESLGSMADKTTPFGPVGGGGWKPFDRQDALQVLTAAHNGSLGE